MRADFLWETSCLRLKCETEAELVLLYKHIPNIVTIIRVRRLEWAGHVVGMSHDRTVKIVFVGTPDGRSKAGRPKLKWLDCIENDLKCMCVKRWRKKAEDRSGRRYWLNCKDL
jgi:hypothetical protein